jgi:hypothetical protein
MSKTKGWTTVQEFICFKIHTSSDYYFRGGGRGQNLDFKGVVSGYRFIKMFDWHWQC